MASGLLQSIESARSRRKLAFLPFLAAGYPSLPAFVAAVRALADAGADCIEVGFPFSDPIADGPTIQSAFAEALRNGVKVTDVFAAVREARKSVQTPLVAMVSYSIVFRHDVNRFCADAKSAGFDGLLIPDLPPPEAESVCQTIRAAGLDTVLLIAPTTSPQRRTEIARLCTGFVYYLSVSGITGERDRLPTDLASNVAAVKAVAKVPVCVGFGISRPEHLRQLVGVADGAIVGSAIIKQIRQHAGGSPESVSDAVATFCRELLSGV
jgi:tryptophan synthase alpha chain